MKTNCDAKTIKKQDIILILIVLAAALAAGSGYYLTHRTPAHRAEVSVNGVVVETIDLSKDQSLTIHSTGGGFNHLIVENGEIWCDKASCPDHVCIMQGKQSLDGGMIVCLPNAMIVVVTDETENTP